MRSFLPPGSAYIVFAQENTAAIEHSFAVPEYAYEMAVNRPCSVCEPRAIGRRGSSHWALMVLVFQIASQRIPRARDACRRSSLYFDLDDADDKRRVLSLLWIVFSDLQLRVELVSLDAGVAVSAFLREFRSKVDGPDIPLVDWALSSVDPHARYCSTPCPGSFV